MLHPKLILPKFIWNYIINYLSYNSIENIIKTNSLFTDIVNETNYKRCFLDDRPDAIAIVKCNTNYITNFWSHAYLNHKPCYYITTVFKIIGNEQRQLILDHNNTFIYYKIFIKDDTYPIHQGVYHEYNNCSIELIGSNSIIKFDDYNEFSDDENGHDRIHINIPMYFAISNITFEKGIYTFCNFPNFSNKYAFDIDHPSFSKYGSKTLVITNCIFNAPLHMESISNIEITKCSFNDYFRFGVQKFEIRFTGNQVSSKIKKYSSSQLVIINITNSTINLEHDFTINCDFGPLSKFNIISCIIKTNQLNVNLYNTINILFKDNSIYGVKQSHVNTLSNVEFDNNVFYDCANFTSHYWLDNKINGNNTFVDII